jgi:hypothetical protein
MKIQKYSDRFFELSEVLHHDRILQENGKKPIFGTIDRWMMNQERAKLLNDDESFEQTQKLEDKICKTLKSITK